MSREKKLSGLCPKELLSEIECLKAENSRLKHTVADQAFRYYDFKAVGKADKFNSAL